MSGQKWTFGGMQPSTPAVSRKRKPSDEPLAFPSMLPNSNSTSPNMSLMAATNNNNYLNLHASSKRFKTGIIAPESNAQMLLAPPRPPTPPIHRPPAIDKVLETLDKNQLIQIMTHLLQQHPVLTTTVAGMLPRPTIKSVSGLFSTLEKKLNDSFPYSKWAPDRSDYSFNRVRPVLIEIKDTIIHYMPYFVEPSSYTRELAHEYPDQAFGFLQMATSLVHRFPLWQNASHNDETRGDLYIVLGRGWNTTCAELVRRVKEEGKMFASSVVTEWGQNLLTHAEHVGGRFGFAEAVETFRATCGWMTPGLALGSNNAIGGLLGSSTNSNNTSSMPYAWMAAGHTPVNGPSSYHHSPSLSQQYH